ncbi:uncharacterized protein At2g39910 [Impatiens glandulifera]|uniref:uncharacterized protein At2g39910 n=1 Tax=Impatiens glandulifera TaxID=253017 RepID=UPI001FB1008A|nr:uncharacterized protein At2g39910 [Impatiens glandulifera]
MAAEMLNTVPLLIPLSQQLKESLSEVQYSPPEASNVSVKSMLLSLLPDADSLSNASESQIRSKTIDLVLFCAALASSVDSNYEQLSWIPHTLSTSANLAFQRLSRAVSCSLVLELMPEMLSRVKDTIKESSVNKLDSGNDISSATARAPVVFAIVAAYQFRWLLTQVECSHLGGICTLVVPCALTALDHWSPEVKGQGMMSFIHVAKNVNASDINWYEDAILDACLQNITSADEIWHLVVEMSVVILTSIHQNNPRSSWFERILTEMLSHLSRQPRHKDRRLAWLQHIEPLFNAIGLVLLAHFRHIFPLFFKWMHADDDETVLLVLERIHTVLKLTWIRNSSYIDRLVDELIILYKEAALKVAREEIRSHVVRNLILIQQCKGTQFEAVWDRYKDDQNLIAVGQSLHVNVIPVDIH